MEPLWVISCIAVNCYVMITGYFLIDKNEMMWNGIIRTWLQTFFYSVSFFIVALIAQVPINKDKILSSLFPIYCQEYWFVTTYIGLLLIAPFLSILASSLTKRNYQFLLGVLFFICFQFLYGRVYAGIRTIIWFSFLYLVAGYIRMYDLPQRLKKNILYIVMGIWIVFVLFATIYNLKAGEFKLVSSTYDGPMFFLSVATFILVLHKPLNNGLCFLLTKIAPYTFGVYLIHENQFVRDWLWNFVIPEQYQYPIILHCLMTCVAVFVVCVLIDFIRQALFKILRINNVAEIVSSKMPH